MVETFKHLYFLSPNQHVIDLFSEAIEPVFQETISLHNQNILLKEARDLLLPRLMSGMIDVDTLTNTNMTARA